MNAYAVYLYFYLLAYLLAATTAMGCIRWLLGGNLKLKDILYIYKQVVLVYTIMFAAASIVIIFQGLIRYE